MPNPFEFLLDVWGCLVLWADGYHFSGGDVFEGTPFFVGVKGQPKGQLPF